MLQEQSGMFYPSFILRIFCLVIEASSIASSMQSKSAFGVMFRENTKATGVELVRSISNAVSLIACNIKCLNDRKCGATNYFPSTSSSQNFQGICQLLYNEPQNDVTFEPKKNAIYTKLQEVKEDNNGGEVLQKDCDDGFSFDSSTARCFIAPAMALPWLDAQQWCHEVGGTLAKVDSFNALNYVRSMTRNALYIGLKQENNGSLIWSDGSLVQSNTFINERVSRSFCNLNETCCSLLDYNSQFRNVALKAYHMFCRAPGYFACEKKSRR